MSGRDPHPEAAFTFCTECQSLSSLRSNGWLRRQTRGPMVHFSKSVADGPRFHPQGLQRCNHLIVVLQKSDLEYDFWSKDR